MKLTWLGCASYKIDCGGTTLWTDPFISMTSNAQYLTTEDTFEDAREILISHGHFDHLMSVPELNAARKIHVHCTETPRETLLQCGMPEERINCCAPGDSFEVGFASVKVYQGEHNTPDLKMALGAVLRTVSSPRNIVNFLKMGAVHKKFPEAGETIIFEIKANGYRVLSMGSLGLPDGVQQPERGADLLVLPYNGLSDPSISSLNIVDKLRPKAVLLSHHDDSIPPLTGKLDVSIFVDAMREEFPKIPVVVPQFGVEMLLSEILGDIEEIKEKEKITRIA